MEPTKEEQSALDRENDRRTIRINQARNGYIVKTGSGPFIFPNLKGVFAFVDSYFMHLGQPKPKPEDQAK